MKLEISARQLQRPDELLEEVTRVFDNIWLASRLSVAYYREQLMRDAAPNVDVLRWFQTLGVDIVVDDFGICYSNLVYIKCFPLDVLKRDESFVEGMDEDTGDTVIVEAVVGLTRALVMSTVAGGIETDGQAELLQTLGCDVGQGYYFAEPLPAWRANILCPREL